MEQENVFTWNIHESLSRLCKVNTQCSSKLRKYLSKQIWKQTDREECLGTLSQLLIDGDCVVDICCCFLPLILEIASRSVLTVLKKGKHALQKFAISLSQGFPICEEIRRFAVDFVRIHKPFSCGGSCDKEPSSKKAKKSKISDLDWCKAMFLYTTYLPQVSQLLDLSTISDHLSSSNPLIRWFAACTLSKHLKMTEQETAVFFRKYFTAEEQRQLTIKIATEMTGLEAKVQHCNNFEMLKGVEQPLSHTQSCITSGDMSPNVVNVMGILLKKVSENTPSEENISSSLVLVPSTLQHLRSLSLAVSTGQPVVLQGPVGCGKTSLVEHLASLTGRTGAPHFLKIQLGDQTDSKALLGTYCSTEVPGEFVWRAGVLTQAVLKGSWVLLEDIDTAPMDILSLLVALAETRTLTVPGHGDEVQAAPGFQLFTTVRLLSSSDGVYHQKGGNTALLEKLCCVINVEPLSREELNQVIKVRFPLLTPISDKLLKIYFSLSASFHDQGEMETGQEEVSRKNVLPSVGGRLISTRDLMSWCRRSSEDFDVDGPTQGLKVFQEALDCFVICISKMSKRQALAVAIGATLNIPEERARYFNSEYKPSIQDHANSLEVGRGKLVKKKLAFAIKSRKAAPVFSYTRSSVTLLEKVAVCVRHNEPVLLVGETGTGKTSTIQFLSHYLGHRLHVLNLNQQSDSTDLLGGFKPVDFRILVMPLREEFESLFCNSFSRAQNEKFLSHIQTLFSQKRWHDLLTLMEAPIQKAFNKFTNDSQELSKWSKVSKRIHELRLQLKEAENVLAFSFIEGTLVRALKNGDWVLLDEINLAAAETLDCLSGLLESGSGSVVLTERGDTKPIKRHPEFRLFACMNPATDVGKKDLPVGIRNRFIEFYVEELECSKDLATLVRDYLPGLSLSSKQVSGIVHFYLGIKNDPSDKLKDGTGHKPHFSLRTLCRALRYSSRNPCGSVPRSLLEGFCLSFLTQLDRSSHPVVEKLIFKHILSGSSVKSVLGQKMPPPDGDVHKYVHVGEYWISKGHLEPSVPSHYIITPSVKMNLKDLCRVVAACKHPVLLQGETSVGKTSLITYLAQLTGNLCVRVNNHEHTDLQEYIGCYAADEHGKLAFREGVLVEAMRKGHWIILDELNLAPSDVLEALNRLLDDNQELFIPETQEVVQAHPKFMLFATQNPPGLYGGRKVLSRAFRNRFIELHFDEIPPVELETILHERCGIPLSYAKKLVAVMLELQTRRSGSGIFFGKQGFMTLRDLFRWAQRYNCPETGKGEKFYDWDQHLADHGYMLLAGRVRKPEEEEVIREVIAKHMKRQVSDEHLFNITSKTSAPLAALLNSVMNQTMPGFEHIVWTYSMRRLAILIGQAIAFKEPVLLVGDTGVGKTTVCQLYAAMEGLDLHMVNCHMHSESADFLGGLRPLRSHEDDEAGEGKLFEWKDGPLVQAMKEGSMFLIDEISLADDSVLERLNSVLEPERTLLLAERGGVGEGYGDTEVEKVVAEDKFHVFATMNPGGDFGKKELSPALRNRFTEIWCPQRMNREELMGIIEKNILPGLQLFNTQDGSCGFGQAIMDFIQWFTNTEFGRRTTISIRDILSWVNFINKSYDKLHLPEWDMNSSMKDVGFRCLDDLRVMLAYLHGACLVFIDSLGAGSSSFNTSVNTQAIRQVCIRFLLKQMFELTGAKLDPVQTGLLLNLSQDGCMPVVVNDNKLIIPPFSIDREPAANTSVEKFALQAPTTCVNAQRVLRGLQLHRPILLEGSPGVGKTSLVSAIARVARRPLVRINLSEQTDVTDLFGADLPVEGEEGGRFAWRDGPFLQALKAGHWVVFDELNLASQSVLEGLNACFDHRGEVYVPELGKTFHIQYASTRIFACQNPLAQGGGRKGLPRSFLNRFTQVFVDPLSHADLSFILMSMYPEFPTDMLNAMVQFNSKIYEETMVNRMWGIRGSPWEFNLRDLFRWYDVIKENQCVDNFNPGEYVGLIYCDRMRSEADKAKVVELFSSLHGERYPVYQSSLCLHVGRSTIQMGHSFLQRSNARGNAQKESSGSNPGNCLTLHHCLEPLESLMKCVELGWLAILLGPQSSGKTSLVRLLAQLTGHSLCVLPMNSSMDTTELLGGFEQTDIWRHLGEVAHMTEIQVRHVELKSLVEGDLRDKSVVSSLETAFSLYKELSGASEGLSSEEVIKLLHQHVKQLQAMVLQLEKIPCHCREAVTGLKHQLSQLSTSVSAMKPGLGGGAFEWVDSVLVKALQTGQWLLIDNVNFCSASVLDRLNALLEPGGVLTINERGTVNGDIVSVHPHTDFRLFFAMDPKRGEISRAMRNRGIEIYIPGEDDGCPYSPHDLHSMLCGIGLEHSPTRDRLLSLHHRLQTTLSFTARPVVADLLQAGSICSQLQSRGFGLKQSLSHALEDVYVSNKRSYSLKQAVRDIVHEELSSFQDEPDQCSTSDAYLSTLKGNNMDSQLLCYAKQTSAFLMDVLQRLHESDNLDSPQTLVQLHSAVTIFTSLQSEQGWMEAQEWLQHSLDSFATQEPSVHSAVGHLNTWTGQCLRQVFNSSTWKELGGYLHQVFGESPSALTLLEDQPWDLNFNPQASTRAMVLHAMATTRVMTQAEKEILGKIQYSNQRLHLSQHCVLLSCVLKDKLKLLEATISKGKQKGPVKTLINLVSLLVSQVVSHLPNLVLELSDDNTLFLYQNINNLKWLSRLSDVVTTCTSVHKDIFTSHLALHWQWTTVKLAPVFNLDSNQYPKFAMAIEELSRHLGRGDVAMKRYVRFWTNLGHPKPYLTAEEADVAIRLKQIIKSVSLSRSDTFLSWKTKVKVLRQWCSSLKMSIRNMVSCLTEGNYGAVHSELREITAILHKSGVLKNERIAPSKKFEVDNESTTKEDTRESDVRASRNVILWPMFDHIILKVGLSLAASQLRHDSGPSLSESIEMATLEKTENVASQLLEFSSLHSPSMTLYSVCNKEAVDEENKEKEKSLKFLNEFLTSLWSSCASRDCHLYLEWKEDLEESITTRTDLGPALLWNSPISKYVMEVFSSKSQPSGSELLPLHVSLGSLERQLQQVALVSRHVWCHGGTLVNRRYDESALAKEILIHSFFRLLGSVEAGEEKSTWQSILSTLSTNTNPQPVFAQLLSVIQSEEDALPPFTLAVLTRCFEVMQDLWTLSEVDSRLQTLTGHGFAYVGLLLLQFLTPHGPVDPVHKAGIKLGHVRTETGEIDWELSIWERYLHLKTGRTISETSKDHLHPRVIYLINRRMHLESSKTKLDKRCAYRPDLTQFIQLSQAIQNFSTNICSVTKITDLVNKLTLKAPISNGDASTASALQEEEVWQNTTERFLAQLKDSYPCYDDIILPVCLAVNQIKLGLRLMASSVKKAVCLQKTSSLKPVCSVIDTLCKFPSISVTTPDLLSLANHRASRGVQDFVHSVFSQSSCSSEGFLKGIKSKILLSSLLCMKAHGFSSRRLDRTLIDSLSQVLDYFTTAWSEHEERQKQIEAEKGALYKYKDETHGDERSEKEKDEAEFTAAYPSYNKDFIDVTGASRLEDVGLKGPGDEDVAADTDSSSLLPMVTPKEMSMVCGIHHSILTSLSHADWLDGNTGADNCSGKEETLTSFLMAYKLGSEVVKNTFDYSGRHVDRSILGSHLLVGGSVLHYLDISGKLSQSQIALESPKGKTYNFYFDANVQEVIKCIPVLDSLSKRVAELRQEWPDHPTLVLLDQIRDRILSFSVSSPVLKFLTGMELVLQKAQDWESNAASFVSMTTQLTEITTIIVQWRKLELSCWSSSLDREEEQCREKASHWWFHLYRLVSDYLSGCVNTTSSEKGETMDIVTSLKTFLEGSSLGEYSLRLDMVMAFHCQLLHMDSSPAQQHLLYVTWNLHQFYHQFLPLVQEELKKARTPIDKQLKGFVKIARWSDLNYWTLKISTEKTHRTVHKHMKQYQTVLKQPVKNLLGEKGDNLISQEVEPVSGFCLEEKLSALNKVIMNQLNHQTQSETTVAMLPISVSGEFSLLSRLPQLCLRMKSHIKKSWKKLKHSKIIEIFESFTGELIEGIHELQGLEVDTNAEKDKQKSQAKGINLRKRKGLSELFRHLTFIGMSYRKGVTGTKHKSGFSSAIDQPPLNLGIHVSPSIQSLWSGCDAYFYRCMTRHAHFIGAYGNPSKELGMADIARCFGFVEHLSHLYLDHRRQLYHLATHTRDLRKKLTVLETFSSMSSKSLPPQTEFKSWLEKVKNLMTQLSQGLEQFAFILDACPSKDDVTQSVHPSPLPVLSLAPSALWSRGDEAWSQCDSNIKNIQQRVKTEQNMIDSLLKKSIFGSHDMQSVLNSLHQVKSMSPTLSSIIDQFAEPGSSDSSCFVSCLHYLTSQVSSLSNDFDQWATCRDGTQDGDSISPNVDLIEMVSDFKTRVNEIVESLLLGVQNMAKLAAAKEEEKKLQLERNKKTQGKGEETDELVEEEDEQPEIEEGHLSKHLLGTVGSVFESMGFGKITKQLAGLMNKLTAITDMPSQGQRLEITECISLLIDIKPLMSTFTLMAERDLGHQVATHRSIGKLLSVLLAVFTELFQKGFCIPPEMSEEMEGEGATEFKDIESGGLGEGEGAKDVSDQIESEDQLEDAKKPGSEEKEEDANDQPEIPEEDNGIEMSEDFDGKLHNMDETEDIDEDENDNRDKEEEQLDKQMGEVDGEQSEKLDERMWGDDEEEQNEDGEEEKEEKDETGGGGMDRKKEEMVAKDDNRDAALAGDEEEEESVEKEEDKDKRDNKMDSDTEYDDDKVNPHEQPETEEQPNALDLPEDLNLDDQEKKGNEEEEAMDVEEENTEKGEENAVDDLEGNEEKDENEDDIPQLEAGNEEEEEEEDTGGNEAERQGRSEEDQEEAEEDEGVDEKDNLKADKALEEKEEEEDGQGKEGESAPEEEKPMSELQRDKEEEKPTKDKSEAAEEAGPTNNETDSTECNVQGEQMEETVKDEEQEERDAVGLSASEKQEGHEGEKSKQATDAGQSQNKQSQRNPGESNQDRTLGSKDKKHRKLKTKDMKEESGDDPEERRQDDEDMTDESKDHTAPEYEHVKDARKSYDAQAVDVATQEQLKEKQAVPNMEDEEGNEMEEDEELAMEEDKEEEASKAPEKRPSKSKSAVDRKDEEDMDEDDVEAGKMRSKVEVEGERILTMTVEGPPQSTVHTIMENLKIADEPSTMDVEMLRSELEGCVRVWSHPEDNAMAMAASEAWQKYLTITSSLSQELCEQLRLLLEPTQATKLKGDYRTGKRLNMRKVIPYIASQFRKDKIWLRRSKPSKRQYQIMVAIDDSASMADNHTKQLAFESLALVSNALTLLESGELAICSFGEEVRLLHPFSESFTNQSGATILQQLSCEQKQTKYGLLLEKALALMQEAKIRQPSTMGNEDTAQLLLILSDGHGVFREGMDNVRKAVQKARAARIFLVFLVMDNPDMKGSILDSRVPMIDSSGKIGEIKTYLEMFPFPFYIILRDINNMPHILSNALRQWFELVTAADR